MMKHIRYFILVYPLPINTRTILPICLSSRPESHLVPTIAVAEIDYAKAVNQFGLEAAWVMGPFSIQGEYLQANAMTSYKIHTAKEQL